jgi:hypothetical protein
VFLGSLSLNIYFSILCASIFLLWYLKIKNRFFLVSGIDRVFIGCSVFFEFFGRICPKYLIYQSHYFYDLLVPLTLILYLKIVNKHWKTLAIIGAILLISICYSLYLYELMAYSIVVILIVYYGLKNFIKLNKYIFIASVFSMAFVFLFNEINLMVGQREVRWLDSNYLPMYITIVNLNLTLNLLLINAKSSRFFTV